MKTALRTAGAIVIAVAVSLALSCSSDVDPLTGSGQGESGFDPGNAPPYFIHFTCEVNWYDINPPDPNIAPHAGRVDWWFATDPDDEDTYTLLNTTTWSAGTFNPGSGLNYNHFGSGYIIRQGTLMYRSLDEQNNSNYLSTTSRDQWRLQPVEYISVYCQVEFIQTPW